MKNERYTDKAMRLATLLYDAMHADTAHTIPGKRLITRRKNALIKHTSTGEKADIWLEEIELQREIFDEQGRLRD